MKNFIQPQLAGAHAPNQFSKVLLWRRAPMMIRWNTREKNHPKASLKMMTQSLRSRIRDSQHISQIINSIHWFALEALSITRQCLYQINNQSVYLKVSISSCHPWEIAPAKLPGHHCAFEHHCGCRTSRTSRRLGLYAGCGQGLMSLNSCGLVQC